MSLNSPPYTEEAASGEDLERRKSASKVTLPLRAAGAEPEGTSVKNLSEDQDPMWKSLRAAIHAVLEPAPSLHFNRDVI